VEEITYSDLEISLSSVGGSRYRIQVRYWPASDDALQPAATGVARLDPGEFLSLSPEDYGRLLAKQLFETLAVRDRFLQAQQDTYARGQNPTGLRIRLCFDPGTEPLQSLRWETLCGPLRDELGPVQLPLSTQDLVPFSRFVGSLNNRRVRLRPRGQLCALVSIASPDIQEGEGESEALAVVDVDEEWARARTALQALPVPPLLLARHDGAADLPTRKRLLDELSKGRYDIVYLVCHGVLDDNEPFLLLETDQGEHDYMPGSVLVEALAGLPEAPRLVVLTACQSAGTSRSNDTGAHLALGPELVRAGVPAVVAMNGKVTVPTADEFYGRFFEELLKHGCVDRAMTTARRTIKNLSRPDWWMPTLYMRLSAGRIWSISHLTDREQEPYEELSMSLQNETCTPIVGPSVLEPVWGMPRIVAREWAERRGFPLAPYRSDELASVAQYLARRRNGVANRTFVVQTWLGTMEGLLSKHWPDLADRIDGFADLRPAQRVASLVSEAGARLRQNEFDPFRLLARLPVEVYLTATPDPLLADALSAADPPREPIVEYARWTDALKLKPRTFDEGNKYQSISREHPLVFHLFGTLDEPDSMVLTEDDFFDYLIHVVQDTNNTAIPGLVRAAWSNNALILLGFDLDDWTFRALYRAIIYEPGHSLRLKQGTLSAAVQLTPEEDRNLRPQSALEYLEQVFGSESISLSWSEPQEFLREVWQRLPPAFGGPP
jgi:CHAT domain/SIR2-like domain